ncbi:MAG: hypothetical protein KDI02_26680 [Anaerolineae bacterium]|nr:hypothetical protein [Anaerolineae bacterium]
MKIEVWSVKVYFDLTVNDKASFVAPPMPPIFQPSAVGPPSAKRLPAILEPYL